MVAFDRVPVMVRAGDPISRMGMVAQLAHRREVRLLHDGDQAGSAVTIVLGDEVNEPTLREIRSVRRTGEGRVVLVVARLDDTGLLNAVEAGVSSLLRRDEVTVDGIIAAVRAAATGAGSMPPDLLGRLFDHVGRVQRDVLSPRGLSFAVFSDREISVLRLIADGHDTVEVGRRLFFSERTVKNIIHDVTSRLNLRNRTHAVAFAMREGLI